MAMLGIMCFSFIFNSKLSKIYRGLSILLFLFFIQLIII
jgi:hypothetical protein